MRKQIVAAGALPLQRRAERFAVHRDQHQTELSGEMLGCRLGDLRRGREMDEAVASIDIRSAKRAIGLGRMPRLSLADFIDRRHRLPIRTSQTARPYRPLSVEAIIPIM